MSRRLLVYLLSTFAVTWGAWGSLAVLAARGALSYGQAPFMALYILGGFGPAIGAYAALLATPGQGPLGEYHRRLLRWRVAPWLYAAAPGLPLAIAAMALGIALQLNPALSAAVTVKPWTAFLPLFGMMLVGGGVEELGWRGIAQPELARRHGPLPAALVVGLVWALWHLPLFHIPGVSQYGGSFPHFAAGVFGSALLLAGVYQRSGSILLCIVCHAAGNAATAMGLAVPAQALWLSLLAPCLSALAGAGLLLPARRAPGGSAPQGA